MKIVYFSFTGNCRRFLSMANIEENNIVELNKDLKVEEDYILLTPTIGFGEVPEPVNQFLKNNENKPKGVVASGNRNWGTNFANAANIINENYNVPILMKIELHGTKQDVENFTKMYMEMN